MKKIFAIIAAAGISTFEYKEKNKLCGYELNTYTDGGVNQIVFIDFRNKDENPKKAEDFKKLFLQYVKDIDIDDEIEINRQNKAYRDAFTLRESLNDFEAWKEKLLKLAQSL